MSRTDLSFRPLWRSGGRLLRAKVSGEDGVGVWSSDIEGGEGVYELDLIVYGVIISTSGSVAGPQSISEGETSMISMSCLQEVSASAG